MADIMDQAHPDWLVFRQLLHKAVFGPPRRCAGTKDRVATRAVLQKYFPEVDIPATLAHFDDQGGYCDCEVLINVR